MLPFFMQMPSDVLGPETHSITQLMSLTKVIVAVPVYSLPSKFFPYTVYSPPTSTAAAGPIRAAQAAMAIATRRI
jgi:hypothetical protein